MIEKGRMNTNKRNKSLQGCSVLVVMLFVLNAVAVAQDPVFEFQAPGGVAFYPLATPETGTFTGSISIEQTVTPGGGAEDPIETGGYSLGMAHDPSLLSINTATSVVVGPAGEIPLFDTINLFPEGLTQGVVFDVAARWTLTFSVSTPVIDIEYQLLAGSLTDAADPTVTTLDFVETLGDPPTVNVVVPNGGGASLAATGVSGSLTLTPYEGSQFVRGDVTGDGALDLADGIGVLMFLFLNSSTTCSNALDADDTGNVSISDAVRILCAVFCLDSPPPADPFPGCGIDLTEDDLSCEEHSGCP